MSQRVLKFRAWDNKNKSFHKNLRHYFILNFNGDIGIFQEDDVFVFKPDSFVIQQSTGLLDKNGKEIYEGDFVKLTFDPKECDTLEGVEEVKWQQEYCGFFPFLYRYFGLISTEVIGNIFENPELLK